MADFSEHIVNQRFKKVFHELEKRNLIKGKSDIAKKLGTYNHVINSILKGQRNVTVDQLNKLFDHYHIDANFLFGNSEEMFMEHAPILEGLPTRALSERENYGRNNIKLIPHRALAGVAIEDQNVLSNMEGKLFSVPGMDGELIAIEISGDSMYPTLTNGDIVICEPLERGAPVRDNQVYVIVTDVVVAKRVQQIRTDADATQLRLISDNDVVYKPYTVDSEEVRQILKVKCRLTDHAIN